MKRYIKTSAFDFELRLFHDTAKAMKYLSKKGLNAEPREGSDAQTFAVMGADDFAIAVVYTADSPSPAYMAAVMAHEASHVSRRFFEFIGEDEPGDEQQAYLIESVTMALVEMHLKWAIKHG